MRDPAIPGNVLTVDDFRFGRLGNRFWALGVNLKLGYCCKSKLVSAGRLVNIHLFGEVLCLATTGSLKKRGT